MCNKKTMISLAVGSVVAATLGAVPVVSAADSPFAAKSLDKTQIKTTAFDNGSTANCESACRYADLVLL